MIGHFKKSTQNHDWDDNTISHNISHMSKHGFDQDKNAIIKTESIVAKMQIKDIVLLNYYSVARFFFTKEFKILFFQ